MVACTIWYTNYETNTAGHLPTLGWSCSHFRGALTENLHAQTSNTAAREQTAEREEPRLSQGTNWTCSHVWIFHSLFQCARRIGNSISGVWWRDTRVWHRLGFGRNECPWEFWDIQLWISNKGFGGTYTVRNYREIYKFKDTVNRFLIKQFTTKQCA